jgi:hypothetical protein
VSFLREGPPDDHPKKTWTAGAIFLDFALHHAAG